jgi:hypothetical protein
MNLNKTRRYSIAICTHFPLFGQHFISIHLTFLRRQNGLAFQNCGVRIETQKGPSVRQWIEAAHTTNDFLSAIQIICQENNFHKDDRAVIVSQSGVNR